MRDTTNDGIARKSLTGRTVTIYDDPITRLQPEGRARIIRVRTYDDHGEYGLAWCDVRFVDDNDHCSTPRFVRFPTPEDPS